LVLLLLLLLLNYIADCLKFVEKIKETNKGNGRFVVERQEASGVRRNRIHMDLRADIYDMYDFTEH